MNNVYIYCKYIGWFVEEKKTFRGRGQGYRVGGTFGNK